MLIALQARQLNLPASWIIQSQMWSRLRRWTFSRVVLTLLADIYVSQPMNETFYSSISDQSTGLLGLLPRTVTLMTMIVIIMTETKLGESAHFSSEFMPPGYSPPIRKDRQSGGGGVLVSVKDCYVVSDVDPSGTWSIVERSDYVYIRTITIIARSSDDRHTIVRMGTEKDRAQTFTNVHRQTFGRERCLIVRWLIVTFTFLPFPFGPPCLYPYF